MKEMNTAQKRKHAALIRITATKRNDDDLQLTLAYADRLEAEADLEDAHVGRRPEIAEHADVEQVVPILGRIVCSGGVIKSVEHEWTDAHEGEAKRQGIMLKWWWTSSLSSPAAGTCAYFYAGTRQSGPLAQWFSDEGHWARCKSKMNFGKNWACGGNWERERVNPGEAPPEGSKIYQHKYVYDSLATCNPELNDAIEEIIRSLAPSGASRIVAAEAKAEASRLRQRAVTFRISAQNYRRLAGKPAYEGHELICEQRATKADANAEVYEAKAELVLANANA